jgi:hypothetical protein
MEGGPDGFGAGKRQRDASNIHPLHLNRPRRMPSRSAFMNCVQVESRKPSN